MSETQEASQRRAKRGRIRSVVKARNRWGGRAVEKPGGMERDEERLGREAQKAAEQMRENAQAAGKPSPKS
jgi:hypothetical protein